MYIYIKTERHNVQLLLKPSSERNSYLIKSSLLMKKVRCIFFAIFYLYFCQ